VQLLASQEGHFLIELFTLIMCRNEGKTFHSTFTIGILFNSVYLYTCIEYRYFNINVSKLLQFFHVGRQVGISCPVYYFDFHPVTVHNHQSGCVSQMYGHPTAAKVL
jgi:hypothetical protein